MRYPASFDPSRLPGIETDVLIIGSGIAGLTAALAAAEKCRVIVLSKYRLEDCATSKAQGGIAAAVGSSDSAITHFKDTVNAGAGLCNEDAVRVLVTEARDRIEELVNLGMDFDRKDSGFDLVIEGGHTRPRILHSKDSTGFNLENVLIRAVRNNRNITVRENTFCTDLLVNDRICWGALCINDRMLTIRAKSTILATGGIGQIFSNTTNPEISTGDGIVMAYRAGAVLSDLEFIQFHPTVLYKKGFPRYLISESIRGAGAILLNKNGERFLQKYDDRGELAPRDLVSMAIHLEMARQHSEFVYLDATGIKDVEKRFPTIYHTCMEYGIDLKKDKVPIAPAAHYLMGGISADLHGRTNIHGLHACGECACTGVHGANRLASNSLLEGLVFGKRAGESAADFAMKNDIHSFSTSNQKETKKRIVGTGRLKEIMDRCAWIVRSEKVMEDGMRKIQEMKKFLLSDPMDIKGYEYANMLILSELVLKSALMREESRGAHIRSDFPERDDRKWRRHISLQIDY